MMVREGGRGVEKEEESEGEKRVEVVRVCGCVSESVGVVVRAHTSRAPEHWRIEFHRSITMLCSDKQMRFVCATNPQSSAVPNLLHVRLLL